MIADLVEVVARPASRPASHECNTESPPRNAPSPRFVEKRWNMGRRTLCSSPSLSIPSEPVSHPDASSDEGYILTQAQVAELKADVSRSSKDNFELERRVRQFDRRIGLLIGLRITYDKEDLERLDFRKVSSSGRVAHERTSSWPTEIQTQHYGNLFFLLQTKPKYMARLARQVGAQWIDNLLNMIMFTLYGHHYDPREEHLLLCMFEHALMLEFEQAADVTCVLRQNSAITRMMTSYTRRGPGQEYLRQVLTAPVVFLSSLEDNLEVNLVEIFKELAEKGKISGGHDLLNLPYADLEEMAKTNEQVLRNAEIRTKRLEEVLETLLSCIFRSASIVPFGIRWLCRTIRSYVHRYFPNAKETEASMSLVGGFFFLRFINPTIVSPHVCHITSTSPGKQARRTLTLVAKVIQKIANMVSKGSKPTESFMSPFDDFICRYQEKLKDFLAELCDVDPFHDFMQVEHFMAFSKNSVTVDVDLSDLRDLHSLLVQHREKLTFTPQDRLNEVLQDLGPLPQGVSSGCSKATLRLASRWHIGDDSLKALDESFNDTHFDPDIMGITGVSAQDPQLGLCQTRCLTLLTRLLKMVPESQRNLPVSCVLAYASTSSIQQIKDVGSVSEIMVQTLQQNGIVVDNMPEYTELIASLPSQDDLHSKYRGELVYLIRIKTLVAEHFRFLREQLETYKAYLAAVRKQAVSSPSRTQVSSRRRQNRQPAKASISAMVRESVIVACPASRRGDAVEVVSPSPGHYVFSLAITRPQDDMPSISMEIQLENLLELRSASDPTFVLAGNIAFDAGATIHWLQRYMR